MNYILKDVISNITRKRLIYEDEPNNPVTIVLVHFGILPWSEVFKVSQVLLEDLIDDYGKENVIST